MERRLLVALVMLLALGVVTVGSADGGAQMVSVNWADKPLSEVLSTLKANYGVNYALPSEFGSIPVSLNLYGVTVDRAVQAAAQKAGLTATKSGNTWLLSRPEAKTPATGTAVYAQFPGMGMGGSMEMPMMPEANPAGMELSMPSASGGFGGIPGRTVASSQQGAAGTTQQGMFGLTQQRTNLNFVVIPLFRSDPISIGTAFGGPDMVVEDMTSSAGSGGNGGNGNNSGYGNNSGGYGNNNGSNRGGRGNNNNSGYGGGNNNNSNRSNRSNRNY
ncbi:STN domain-containing protein [bacterium]|nr:STN domain-containing protein [bacterium]